MSDVSCQTESTLIVPAIPKALLTTKDSVQIRYCQPFMTGQEQQNIATALANPASAGQFTMKCQDILTKMTGHMALLTQSCTSALEMSAILAEIKPGDEVIMPSYTFVSTANAFVLHGATVVFVDVLLDTVCMDPAAFKAAITPKTKAVVVVHYAGVICEMDEICATAKQHDIMVIEDAAQAIGSTYKGRPAGGLGDLAAFSFHYTKNVISGEGGAITVASEALQKRAWIVWEKGTNRHDFITGKVDKYYWVDVGSSFLPSEMTAAFLYSQLPHAAEINGRRVAVWQRYHSTLEPLEAKGWLRRPRVPEHCTTNGHIYHVLVPEHRNALISFMNDKKIQCFTHYVPLHDTPAGSSFGRSHGTMTNTATVFEQLIRLPLWPDLPMESVDLVCSLIEKALEQACGK